MIHTLRALPIKRTICGTISRGDVNTGISTESVKISIRSIKPHVESGSFGTFDLLVRDGDDTDAKPEVLEEYLNVNLDTNSSDYIARRVGDSAPFTDNVDSTYPKMFYQGDYSNKSKFIS